MKFSLLFLIIVAPPRETAPAPRAATIAVTPDVAAKLQLIAFQAARDGDVKTLQAYLESGFNVNDANTRGDTLLTVAAYNKQPDAVKLILKQPKIAIDLKNRMGLTALAAAAFQGDVEIAKQLIAAKADVNAVNGSGQSSLMFAALSGKTKMVEYLLDAGADATLKDTAGNTAASLAKGQGAEDVKKLIEATRKP